MNFKEFQQQIIDAYHEKGARTGEFKRLRMTVDMNDPVAFIRVLLHSHSWCIDGDIYDAALLLSVDEQDILLRAGLRTQLNVPIDFHPERVAGRLWKPYNEGATADNGVGTYMTFKQANDQNSGLLVPSENDFIALSTQKREWAVYQGQFGYLFNGRLFIPAGGFRAAGYNGLFGALGNVGYGGYLWSSAVSGTGAMGLYFYSSWLYPSYTYHRGHGFQVRCLQEI